MPLFKIEVGLPPYGPAAVSFPKPTAASEGLVVSFVTSDGHRWTGNFAYGSGQTSEVRPELGRNALIVVAKGAGYCVDIDQRLAKEIIGPVEYLEYVDGYGLMVVANGLWFEAIDQSGPRWRSRRVSWDGMKHIRIEGSSIYGDGYAPTLPPSWSAFKVDLRTGEVVSSSYTGPNP